MHPITRAHGYIMACILFMCSVLCTRHIWGNNERTSPCPYSEEMWFTHQVRSKNHSRSFLLIVIDLKRGRERTTKERNKKRKLGKNEESHNVGHVLLPRTPQANFYLQWVPDNCPMSLRDTRRASENVLYSTNNSNTGQQCLPQHRPGRRCFLDNGKQQPWFCRDPEK